MKSLCHRLRPRYVPTLCSSKASQLANMQGLTAGTAARMVGNQMYKSLNIPAIDLSWCIRWVQKHAEGLQLGATRVSSRVLGDLTLSRLSFTVAEVLGHEICSPINCTVAHTPHRVCQLASVAPACPHTITYIRLSPIVHTFFIQQMHT
jgi:hypothetical protein